MGNIACFGDLDTDHAWVLFFQGVLPHFIYKVTTIKGVKASWTYSTLACSRAPFLSYNTLYLNHKLMLCINALKLLQRPTKNIL